MLLVQQVGQRLKSPRWRRRWRRIRHLGIIAKYKKWNYYWNMRKRERKWMRLMNGRVKGHSFHASFVYFERKFSNNVPRLRSYVTCPCSSSQQLARSKHLKRSTWNKSVKFPTTRTRRPAVRSGSDCFCCCCRARTNDRLLIITKGAQETKKERKEKREKERGSTDCPCDDEESRGRGRANEGIVTSTTEWTPC